MIRRDRILVVDDTEINRSLLADMLSDDYEILEAKNGVEALSIINRHHATISLVLLDIVMPEMDGFEVLAAMNSAGYLSSIPVIIISAENGSLYTDHAYDLGAVEYIFRPFDVKTVQRRVKNTIMLYSKQKLLEDMVTEQLLEKEKSSLVMVEILSHIVEFRNGESGLHVLHIRVITEMLLKFLVKLTDQYALTPARISLIANASVLHDIGKISIPESILNKPGRLSDKEYEIMKTHSAAGAEMLESVAYYQSEELVQVARDICRWHHERYDGRGYPDGLRGEEIPIAAQVVSLADVYDALTSVRVYKPAYTQAEAMRMILGGECGAFNPLLLQCLREAAPLFERELRLRSAGRTTRDEVRTVAHSLIQSGAVSNRTLTLLEQERTKYLFFASMSNEIQFEYEEHTDMLTISDWGAALLGIPAVIAHPARSADLERVFSPADYQDLRTRLSEATSDDPVVTRLYQLDVQEELRWYKVVARPLWMEEGVQSGVIGKFTDIHEQQLELDQLKRMARHDSLTGLYNREYARRLIVRRLSKGLEEKHKYALLLLDLDHFKQANDNHGHIFGDKVLGEVASTLLRSTRDTDVVARIGGDEFLVFLEYRDEIPPLASRIFAAISGSYRGFPIAASMGVALAPKDGEDYDSLFHRADQALYTAKQSGRSRLCYYDDTMKTLFSVLSPVESEGQA